MSRVFLAAAGVLLLAGCGALGGPRTEIRIYDPVSTVTVDPSWPQADWSLSIGVQAANQVLDSARIAVRPTPDRFQTYKGASWSDKPGDLLQTALVEAFEDSGKLRAVSRFGNSGARGDRLAQRQRAEADATLAEARRAVEVITPLRIDLPRARLPANRTLLRFEQVVATREERRLFGPLSFAITGPERVAVSGANGSGKTTLLRLALGLDAPEEGRISRADGALALLDQHVALLDPARDLVANLRAHHPALTAGEAHAVLARFAFRNRDALRPAATLSGGEALRAGLAIVTAGPTPPQMLVLDEPTNHLDIAALEMLEAALATYDGALLLVSHDRRFLDAVGVTREIALGEERG